MQNKNRDFPVRRTESRRDARVAETVKNTLLFLKTRAFQRPLLRTLFKTRAHRPFSTF